MARDCDVLIVGGGLNGPVLALALAQGGLSSIVLDARPAEVRADPAFDGRAYALALGSRRMLAALGLWARARRRGRRRSSEIKISDGRAGEGAGRLFLHFDQHEIDEGPMGHILEDRYLRAALAAAMAGVAAGRGAAAGPRSTGQAAAPGGVAVTLADGGRLRGALLVGCDGRDSQVARRAGHPAARARLRPDLARLRGGARAAAPRDRAPVLHAGRGRSPSCRCRANRSSIVWTETTRAGRGDRGRWTTAGYLAELRPRFGDFLGEIGLAGARYSYPLGLSLAERMTRASGWRWPATRRTASTRWPGRG